MNPSQDNYQRRLIRIGLIVAVGFVLLALTAFLLGRNGRRAQTTDPDTGEVIYSDGRTPEKQAGGGDIILLGSSVLTDNGATQDQFIKIKSLLLDYGHQNLHSAFDRLAIVPDTITASDGVLTGELRLGTKEVRVDLIIKLVALKQVQVIIKDPSHKYTDYDSGLQDAVTASPNQQFDSGDGTPPDQTGP